MTDYAGFVRPFQTPGYAPPAQPAQTPVTSNNLILKIGASSKGSFRVEHLSWDFSVTRYMTKQKREIGDTSGIGEF